jgi:ribonucleotide reductase alpha subunit
LGETEYPDPDVQGYNPCAEQSLADKETCCLAEIYLPNIESFEEFVDVATLLYRVNKHSLALPCHLEDTEKIVHKNMRMGIGVTGVLQATEEQKGWLNKAYEKLRNYDEWYSQKHGFNKSIKLTTVKPSGTLSLLPGVTPGCHPAYARYMVRRIRISSNHSLVDVCRKHGYPVEYQQNFDGSEDRSTVVVSFPFTHGDTAVLADQMTAIDQLETVKWLQETWSDNSVSCTVYYRKEELPEIRKYLKKNYKNGHKSLSFLLHSDHGFKQAPLEEITKEQYDELVAKTIPITSISELDIGLDDSECASGACPIR